MSGQGRGGGSSSSGRSSSGRRDRDRSSRSFVVERSQPIRGIISGVGVGRERDKESQRNAGKQSPVPRNPEREDSKISTHTRTLSRAESEEIFSRACQSIETLLEIPENRKYISKNFSFLEHHMLDCFKWISGAIWKESGIKMYGRLIGIIFNSMGNHSTIICNWLTDSIFSSTETRKYSLTFVIRDVVLVAITHMVPHQISILMKSIHEQIEGISDPVVFRLFSTIFSTGILRNQDNTEFEMFSDFTDVVIGWMTDGYETELGDTFFHLYALIQELEPFFVRELGFLRDLISSIVDYIKEAATEEPVNGVRIIRLLKTLEALLALRAQLDKKFLKATLESLVETMNGILSDSVDEESQQRKCREFIHFTNECLALVPGIDGKGIQCFIKNQLQLFQSQKSSIACWNSELLTGSLAMLNCWVETIGTQSQLSVEIQELCGDIMSFFDHNQLYFPQEDQLSILRVSQSLLRTRNLTLLQNVYQWVLGKLQRETVESGIVFRADVETQLIVLATLTDIATNKSGSILSLWALDPSLIDLLMSMSQYSSDDSARHSALEILKSHCIAHSHFASNITSSKIFEAETPTLRFLNSLLNFWTSLLDQINFPKISWLFDWIFLFFKSTVPYAPLLVERHLDFYTKVLHQLSNRRKLKDPFGLLLEWMAQDLNYVQSSQLQEVIREICLKILLAPNEAEASRSKYSEILKLLPNLIILPEELSNRALAGEWIDSGPGDEDSQVPILANPELNTFLKDLLLIGGRNDQSTSSIERVPSKSEIKAAVDYVIRLKLKTSLGRAPEFFSQLQNMVRKILRRGVRESYFWKLDFVYQLQRKIHLCIYESAFLPSDIPEVIRSFYVTNKLPCTGWLKRMGPECIEVSFALKCYAMAYYFAVSIGEEQKAKLALLELQDAEGLRGMKELGGYFYLKEEYEKAEHLATSSLSNGPDPVADIILARTSLIFAGSAAKLETWAMPPPPLPPQPLDLNGLSQILPSKPPVALVLPPPPPWNSRLLQLPVESCRTVLSLQLGHVGSVAGTDVIGSLESFSKMKLYEMVQVEDLILHSKKFTIDEKRRIQNCKLEKMIECGNVKSLRNWITASGWLKTDSVDMTLERQVDTYKILGDLLFREGDFFESGTLYSCILELIDKDGNEYTDTTPIPNDFKASFYLAFADKVKKSTPFYERAVTKSNLLTALEGRHQAQQLFYDRARETSRTSSTQVRADAWFDYASFAYGRSEKGLTPILKEVLKSNALHSYANYIKWNQKKSSHEGRQGKIILAMIRLVKLYYQNHKFIPEDLVTSNLWLTILPELAKIHELRPYLLSKYPWATNFLIASLEYVKGRTQFARRRGIFDPTTFAFTEASEEPYDGSDQTKICLLEAKCEGSTVEKVLEEYWRGGIPKQAMATGPSNDNNGPQLGHYLTLVEEIERIGTTKEELWAEVIQRSTSDWVKRITTLRKDMARDRDREIRGNPEKVKAYVRPVVTYLKEVWRLTMDCDTPSDVAFICKYCDKIANVLNDLEKCTTLDKLTQIYETLQYYASVFESSSSSKLALLNVSPVLARCNFSDSPVTLPGMGDGVTVSSVHNTITCLHTKTNPKRIGVRGSNGRLYEYLIKGNENLHIDAGIMQLLRVTAEFSGCPTRHYSVTPIGERGGLIQIVPNAVPLFAMYKKYLQRNNATERPSEMFWRRLESLGFKDREDVEGLKEVYKSLKEETPPDLISRDMLMCAENTNDWYKAVQTYTRDTAMGSAYGHVLELADRHLDNILINLREGHLVHVDFSILFGKGTFLKVPERVPFRLTQNIVDALQYPGVNGSFAVYLDKFLQKFNDEKEMTLYCVNNIAMDSLLEEGVHVSPEIILRAELISTLDLIRLRIKNIWRIMELVITEIQECTVQAKGSSSSSVWLMSSPRNAGDRLRKRLNRWRRLLANVDPLITFVVTHTCPTGSLTGFHATVFNKWIPYVMHFWSHADIEVVVQSSSLFEDRFKICEKILQDFLREIPTDNSNITMEICSGPILPSGEQRVDKGKLEAIMNSANSRISAYIPSETANALISEATAEDNLAQMYEGWIPWV